MRRKDREVKSFDEIIDILSRCKVLHLALISEGKPYSVPLNFGYVLEEDAGAKKLTVYFHCAPEGKKLTAIKENPEVCFSAESLAEADGDKEKACTWTCYYESVIGFGKAEILTDSDERTKGLDAIMFHHGFNLPAGVKKIAYNAMELARTEVVKIDVAEITGKHHLKK
ncbi:MAG: pyridoxamine 5'-phosphate oxidase family protein [Treponema sp.]|nr:pyridoxamine 5'-phosphate oxidase family protein [Treponema sp.]